MEGVVVIPWDIQRTVRRNGCVFDDRLLWRLDALQKLLTLRMRTVLEPDEGIKKAATEDGPRKRNEDGCHG
jgi:hypothetical protein